MIGLAAESSVEIGFIPHNPRLPGPFKFLQRIKYLRTVVNTLVYWLMAVTRLWRYDVVHAHFFMSGLVALQLKSELGSVSYTHLTLPTNREV